MLRACGLIALSVFLLAVQGSKVRRLNRLDSEDTERVYRLDEELSEFNDHIHSISRKQAAQPVAESPITLNNSHQFARIRYAGEGSNVIQVITYDTGSSAKLYRSINYGMTFDEEDEKFPSNAELSSSYFFFSVTDQIFVFTDRVTNTLYITQDAGDTYTVRSIPVEPSTLLFHPTQPSYMMGLRGRNLQVSLDMGLTWEQLATQIVSTVDYSWGVAGIDWREDASNPLDTAVLYYNPFERPESLRDNLFRLYIARYSMASSGFESEVFDPDYGKHHDFLIDDRYIFGSRLVFGSMTTAELVVSYNRGPFVPAVIPHFDQQNSFTLALHRSSQALVIVEHISGIHNLYFSDDTGVYYTLSLENIMADRRIEIHRVSGINGTLIANQKQGSQGSRTMITFDNGANWGPIGAPTVDADGDPIDCRLSSSCSLHFQMQGSPEYSALAVYSRSSAPGIIVARGNFGTGLSSSVVNVYVSGDAGLTWVESLKGSWDVEAMDHGGVMIATLDFHNNASTVLKYSCDEGTSWSDFEYTDESMVVRGIITQPGETTINALLFGNQFDTDSLWMIVPVHFAGIFSGTCMDQDYYNWTLSDGRVGTNDCLFGTTTVIERRRADTCCRNQREYERIFSGVVCECTSADFECETGYRRDDSNKCVLDTDFEDLAPQGRCVTGYRQIPGDVCVDGVIYDFLPTPGCESSGSGDGSATNTSTNGPTQGTNPSIVSSNPTGTTNPVTGDDDDSNVAVPVVASIVSVLAVLALIALIVLIALFLLSRKRRKCVDETDDLQVIKAPDDAKAVEALSYSDLNAKNEYS